LPQFQPCVQPRTAEAAAVAAAGAVGGIVELVGRQSGAGHSYEQGWLGMVALTVNQQMQLQEQLLLLQADRQRQDTPEIHQEQHPLQAEAERMVPCPLAFVQKSMIFPELQKKKRINRYRSVQI
jgi:hypothetical protein